VKKTLLVLAALALSCAHLCAQDADRSPLVLRSYGVTGRFVQLFGAAIKPDSETLRTEQMTADVARFVQPKQDYLMASMAECGLVFPEGSFVRYNRRIDRLFMKNTEENHRLLVYLLHKWGALPTQIKIEFAAVSFARAELAPLARASTKAVTPTEQIQKLWTGGKGMLESAVTVLTRSRQCATLKAVEEIMYAAAHLPAPPPPAPPLPPAPKLSEQAPPGFGKGKGGRPPAAQPKQQMQSRAAPAAKPTPVQFKTRETGTILELTPVLEDDGTTIRLVLNPTLVSSPVWKDAQYANETLRLPQFYSRTMRSVVTLKNGRTLVLGGMDSKDAERTTYVFVTAQVVDREGTPVPEYPFDR